MRGKSDRVTEGASPSLGVPLGPGSLRSFGVHLEHLECSLQPSPPGCFTKKLSEARGNGIGFVAFSAVSPVCGGGPIGTPPACASRPLTHSSTRKRHGESHEATHAQQPGLTCDQPCSAWPPPPMLSRPSLTRC